MNKDIKLSKFLKVAYDNGRVLDVKESFEEFPVQEEWHKGKVEYVLKND